MLFIYTLRDINFSDLWITPGPRGLDKQGSTVFTEQLYAVYSSQESESYTIYIT